MSIQTFIASLHNQNVQVWIDGDRLRCSGPQAVLTPALKAELAARKAEILAYLRAAPGPSGPTAPAAVNPYQLPEPKPANALTPQQRQYLQAFIERYTQRTPGSKRWMQTYRPVLADYDSSAGFRRDLKELHYLPVSDHAQGTRVWDIDGNEYIDFCMGFGVNFFGHAPAFERAAIEAELQRGMALGPHWHLAGEVAQLVYELTGLERVTFVNSGTEAVMAALRIARAVTGRAKIALFAGSYHGTFDGLLVVRYRRPDGTLSALPMVPGVTRSMAEDVIVLEYGDPEALQVIQAHAHELAAVLVEPVQSRKPDLQPREFLHALRQLTAEAGVALIFDEMITGFRIHPGGAQAWFGVSADIATYGKVVGGGMPVGIVAGTAKYMDVVDGGQWQYGDASAPTVATTFITGTFSRHPLCLAAMRALLTEFKRAGPALQEQLNQRTADLVQQLNAFFDEAQAPIHVVHFGSLFRFTSSEDLSLFYYHLAAKGIYIGVNHNCFLSPMHTGEEVARLVQAVEESIGELHGGGFFPGSFPHSEEITHSASQAQLQVEEQAEPSRAGTLPLTEIQQDFWLATHLGNETAHAAAEGMFLRLKGSLQVDAMRRALQRVVDRHGALRETFDADGEFQRIAPTLALNVPLIDLSHFGPEEREAQVVEWMAAQSQQPFDLVNGPLFRCHILKLGPQEHLLCPDAHHLVMDGWSFELLFKELVELYPGECQGRPAHLPEPMQYEEYVHWQEGQRTSPKRATDEAFWLGQFSDSIPVLDLPTDRPRPKILTYAGAREHEQLDASLIGPVKKWSGQHGATLFMTLLTTYAVFLKRLTGQDDLVIGVPTAMRSLRGSENLIGYCVNVMPIRIRMDGDPRFSDLLVSVRRTLLQCYEHADYPFGALIRKLNPVRDPSRLPLFAVGFNLDRRVSLPPLNDLAYDLVPRPVSSTQYDLVLDILEANEEFQLDCFYKTDLFDRETIQHWMANLGCLLRAVIANPEEHISALSLLSEAECRRLIVEWNATQTDYSREARKCIHELFQAQAECRPDAVAVVFEDQFLTYRELDRRANQLAHHLQALGVEPETLVGLHIERLPEMVVGLLGVLKAGGAFVPLDPTQPPERLAFMLEDARPLVVLTQAHLLERLSVRDVIVISLDTGWDLVAQESSEEPISRVTFESLAYMIYTSGSTGKPKGVLVPHRGLYNVCYAQRRMFGVNPDDHVLQLASLSFDASIFEIVMALGTGALLCLGARETLLPGTDLLRLMQDLGVTIMTITPSALASLPSDQLSALHTINVAGEACSAELVMRWAKGRHFFNLYGPTEATIWTTAAKCADDGKKPLIGNPIANTQVYLLDSRLHPVPIGVPGELCIGGTGITRGYLNRPDLTADKFVPNPFSAELGARLYRTGDLARYRPSGEIEFLERIDHQVKVRGFRIELGEIEVVLGQHPNVREVVVIALEEEQSPGSKRLVAYVVPSGKIAPTVSALRDFVKAKLPEYMVPSAFVFLNALPLTPSGKIDRRALPSPEGERPELAVAYIAPRTPVEHQLATIWTQVLGLERIGVHDDFFELGGDSILSIQVVSRARQVGLQLTPRQMFQYQTIAGLAAVVETTAAFQAEQGMVTGPVPLTPIQQWFFEQQLPDPHHFNQSVLLTVPPGFDAVRLEHVAQVIVEHHDALRLRFEQQNGEWRQVNVASGDKVSVIQVDLRRVPETELAAVIEREAARLQASLNLTEGPLLRIGYFDLGAERPGRLLLVIHHLAVDGVSWRVLLEDLQTAYEQLGQGQAAQLPSKTTSFKEWSERLTEYARSETLRSERDYWLAEARSRVCSLPTDYAADLSANTVASARSVTQVLETEQTQALLQQVPQAYNTQINDVLLAALAQALAEWTGSTVALIDLEGHGREELFTDVDVSRTVGWFTSLFPVLLKVEKGTGSDQLLPSVKEQLRQIPNRGVGYGLLRYASSDPAIVAQLRALPQAQIGFNYLGQFDQALAGSELLGPASESGGPETSLRGYRSHLIDINGFVLNGQLTLTWSYSTQVHRPETIERLADHFRAILQELIAHCLLPEAGRYTPSDFALARLSPAQLDHVLAAVAHTSGRAAKGRVEDIYPLSPLQQGLLFHSIQAPELGAYFNQLGFSLRGALNIPAFEQAWQHAMEQHSILRTAFVWEGVDEPVQVVCRDVKLPVEQLDWRELSPEEQETRLAAYMEADHWRGFEFSQAPLMRLALIRLTQDSYHLIWSHHHLLLDGWSVFALLQGILSMYEALAHGQPLQVEPHRPYRDYIAWLGQQDIVEAERYWRERLQGFTTPTPLSVDRVTSLVVKGTEIGNEQTVRLSPATTARLQVLAQQHQLTLNTVVEGAWALLLSRYSGEQDVIFGVVVAGRPVTLAGVENMLGLFINTLPTRVRLPADVPILDWLRELQNQQAELRQYEYSPLAQVQTWSEVPRGIPLFESLYVFENYPMSMAVGQKSEQLEIQPRDIIERVTYPLALLPSPGPALELQARYDLRRFEHATIARMLQHLKVVLESIAANPQQLLGSVSVLSEAERQQMLVAWNATQADFPRDRCLHELFEAQVARTPEAVALVFEEQQLTYKELNHKSNQLAHYLRSLGVGPEVLVGIYMQRSIQMVVGLLGILKAGGAYVPLDPTYPKERLAFMLQDAQVSMLLTQQSLMEQLPTLETKIISLDTDWQFIAQKPDVNLDSGVMPENLAYVIYTSGSTGKPKGTLILHQGLANYLTWCQRAYPLAAGQGTLMHSSISFDLTITSLFAPLLAGRQVQLLPEGSEIEALSMALRTGKDYSLIKITPAHLDLLSQQLMPEEVAGRTRAFIIGGENLLAQNITFWQDHVPNTALINEYGPTETVVGCCVYQVPQGKHREGVVPIGRPIINTQLYILDAQLHPVPIGVPGELHIGGVGLARGYWNHPELTAEKFIPNPFSTCPGAQIYKTGDLARYLPDGNIEFLGRVDRQVKIRGFRIEVGEVEAALLTHKDIAECVVDVAPIKETMRGDAKYCVKCVIPSNYPGITFNGESVCSMCLAFDKYKDKAMQYFKTMDDLRSIFEKAKSSQQDKYDCLALYSGGKDSTYMLYQLVGMGLKVLAFTFDNGYLYEGAQANILRVVSELKVDHVFGTTPYMREILHDSLKRYSNVCNNCFKAIYTLSMRLAYEKGIKYVVTGLSRGQIFETRLMNLFQQERDFNVDEIDRTVLEARKLYHRMDDAISKCLDVGIFSDDAIFEEIQFIDFYRYSNVSQEEIFAYLEKHVPWRNPAGTGCTTNCLLNDAGIYVHTKERGFHNYALPTSWEVRLGHETREDALARINSRVDEEAAKRILAEMGYKVRDEHAGRAEKCLAAYYVSEKSLTVSELRTYLSQKVPDYMIPACFMRLDKIPLTPNGKVDHRALPELNTDRPELAAAYVAPRSPTEEILVDIWRAVLGIKQIGIYDNFFELGGHSLLATQVLSRVRSAFQVELLWQPLFEAPTVAGMAENIEVVRWAAQSRLASDTVETGFQEGEL